MIIPFQRLVRRVPDFSHPVMRNIHYLRRFDHDRHSPPLVSRSFSAAGVYDGNQFNGTESIAIDYGPNVGGMGLSASAYVASGTVKYSLPLVGTLLCFVTAAFSPTDGLSHYLCTFGAEGTYPGGPAMDFGKNSDNNWYFGWFTGSDRRAIQAASGTFVSGDTYVAGGTWNATTTRLFIKGKVIKDTGTNSNAAGTNPGNGIAFGTSTTFAARWIRTAGKDAMYWIAIWSRVLTDGEILQISLDPSILFTSPFQTFVPVVGVAAAAAGSKQAAVTVIT